MSNERSSKTTIALCEYLHRYPKPWFAAGYSTRSVIHVLEMDYGGRRTDLNTVKICSAGTVKVVDEADRLHGCAGTLFVLYGHEVDGRLDRIIDHAGHNRMNITTLLDFRSVQE